MTERRRLIVVGGGEHAAVVAEAARSRPDLWELTGFVDPRPCEPLARALALPRLGDDDDARASIGAAWFVLGVGATGVSPRRRDLVARYAGARWATVVHATAWVSPTAALAGGAVVLAAAVVNSGAVAAEHSVVNTGAIVEHGCTLGAFAQLGPGAILGGGVRVGDGAYLGLGCRVRDHVTVGRDATVAMGAVVVAPVPDGAIVVGVPARQKAPDRA